VLEVRSRTTQAEHEDRRLDLLEARAARAERLAAVPEPAASVDTPATTRLER
jgi:hypothetical protein